MSQNDEIKSLLLAILKRLEADKPRFKMIEDNISKLSGQISRIEKHIGLDTVACDASRIKSVLFPCNIDTDATIIDMDISRRIMKMNGYND